MSAVRELAEVDRVFGALAHARRRHILVVLHFRGGRMGAGEIAGRFSCAWPTVTRHLSILVSAGLVRVERRGRERTYAIDRRRLNGVVGRWLQWFERRPS